MCSETIAIFKDIIISSAAFVGTYVAVKGLGIWRKQLIGHAEYDLSRRLLVSLYKYRDVINGVRHPVIWGHEMPHPPKDKEETMTREQIRFYGTSEAYRTRWDKVQTERTSLYADLLEAEALWGVELNDLFKAIFNLQHELLTNVRHHLELIDPDTDESKKESIRGIRKKKREVMYDELSYDENEDEDEYKKEFKEAAKNIEGYLKPKLIVNR